MTDRPVKLTRHADHDPSLICRPALGYGLCEVADAGKAAALRPWWVCPNEPRCPHAAVLHDVYDDEDEVPRCCAEGCQCGARPGAAALDMAATRGVSAGAGRRLAQSGVGPELGSPSLRLGGFGLGLLWIWWRHENSLLLCNETRYRRFTS